VAVDAAGTASEHCTCTSGCSGEGFSGTRSSTAPERGGGGEEPSTCRGRAAAGDVGRGCNLEPSQSIPRDVDSWMSEMPATGADAEGDGARAPAFVAVGERFTSTLPRIAGSDLREARAAAPSTAAVGGEAKDAAVAAMGGMAEAPGAAAGSADQAPTYLAEGRGEGAEGRPDPVVELEEDAGGGRSSRRRQQRSHGCESRER
jgi:hypothetical protein